MGLDMVPKCIRLNDEDGPIPTEVAAPERTAGYVTKTVENQPFFYLPADRSGVLIESVDIKVTVDPTMVVEQRDSIGLVCPTSYYSLTVEEGVVERLVV